MIPGTDRPQPAGTLKMVARLKSLVDHIDPLTNPFETRQQVEYVRGLIKNETNVAAILNLKSRLAAELVRNDQGHEALAELDSLAQLSVQNRINLGVENRATLRLQQAMAYLRIGEQQNCLSNHTSDSCLLPIQGAGIHKLQEGSRAAIDVLQTHLSVMPNDLTARWLLNIAFMTIGEYPDKVPNPFLIPPSVFASEYPLKKFADVAEPVGLHIEGLAGGVVSEDFDRDGDLDLMISQWNLEGQLRYFRNRGDGTFEERTREGGLMGILGGLNIIQADYNNDGLTDVLILRGAWLGKGGRHPRSLLRNNGDGFFEDVTEAAGLLSFGPTQTAVWFDYDNDGWLDLYVGQEGYEEPIPCQLFHNNRDGTFTECGGAAGVNFVGFVKGVVAADYNKDGRPDLYVSRLNGDNLLYRNDGGNSPTSWKFTNVAKEAGVTEPLNSFGTFFFDYNNDGWEDIFVMGYRYRNGVGDQAADYLGLDHQADRCRLFKNNGDGTFSDETKAAGLYRVIQGMGHNFGDLDNDGWIDFYAATGDPNPMTLVPNRMFRNAEGKRFQDVTSAGNFGHLQKGHGVTFADFDNDGDQDVFAVMGGAFRGDRGYWTLFNNPGTTNKSITLHLEGRKSNRSAIGARIKVAVNGPEGPRAIYREVSSGASFGANTLRREIGLGGATTIESVEVFWPATGQTQVFKELQPNEFYRIVEGEAAAQKLNPHRFQLATKGAPKLHIHDGVPSGGIPKGSTGGAE